MIYEPVIGLEVHAELLTKSKMFCGCEVVTSEAAAPNHYVCPVCTGMPGMLPVINRQAVAYTIMTGLALNCAISEFSLFARKNYFYPDLPKGYQISQYEYPLCKNGWLDIEPELGERRRIGIRRAHLEEDTGKLTHVDGGSLVDFNRSGVPLLEIVSEPDMRSVEEVRVYAEKLRAILRYLGVNSGDMEKGVIRFEANISIRPPGSTGLNTRTEVKNLNSFRALVRSVEYELARQQQVVESGGLVQQQTMGWDEARGMTVPQRSKEYADDYRYFPEPDLPPLVVDPAWVEEIRATLPELPDARRDRFEREYGVGHADAARLVEDKAVADYFEEAAPAGPPTAKTIANWLLVDLFRLMNDSGRSIEAVKVRPAALVELIDLVESGAINANTGKRVLGEMFESGEGARSIVERKGLAQISDAGALESAARKAVEANPEEVEKYRAGKEAVLGWFVGQVMQETRGKANPNTVREILKRLLNQGKVS
ncbi:MAG TPA: Asp-tRNA(Asn)/Glu-tRNA(Gln) amidotransferase subunit GatB [Anaerolineae bacterium]|nr:Asp-tRNA(Asn)/Glu-tRNA(Gln) amidotransferase subunit GatB [Anaerolineae bacterium]